MNRPKLISAISGIALFLFLSCSDNMKPVERETLEEYESRLSQSSSSAVASSASSSSEGAGLSSSSGAGSSSSGENADQSSSGEEQKASVSGFSQKGPFLNNSSVTLYELTESLSQTGRSFQGMTDNKGSFEIKGVELASPYALLKADGFYRNEVSGENSAAPITLYAIADMGSKSSANVNILTHLEYYRVLALAEGKSLAAAKRQALGEILKVFGIDGSGFRGSEEMSIFGTGDGDAALLAISILLQGDLSEGSFMALLADFSQKLKENGTWGDKAKMSGMAEWASKADLAAIRDNILGWGLSPNVPDFERYIGSYVNANSGDCNGLNAASEFCSNGRVYSKCGDANCNGKQNYDPATQFCHNNCTVSKCGGKEYVPLEEACQAGVVGKLCGGVWHDPQKDYCHDNQLYACGGKPYNPAIQFCHNFATIYDRCGGSEYNPSTQFCYNSSKVGAKCGTRTETFDPDLYKCVDNGKIYLKTPVSYSNESYNAVLIGTQTWLARNLNHNASGSRCYGDTTGGDSQNRCGTYGRLYNWSTAMALAANCNTSSCASQVQAKHKGVCPTGWHLPSKAELEAMTNYIGGESTAGTKLKATSGWNAHNGASGNGTDDYGFSALPGGVYLLGFTGEVSSWSNVGSNGYWWNTDETNDKFAGHWRQLLTTGGTIEALPGGTKLDMISVRCVKD